MAGPQRKISSTRRGSRGVPRPEREQQMLAVAGEVFASRGFHEASMDEIAARAGISKPMLYHYFESKEGLYTSYLQLSGRRLLAAMEAVTDRSLPPEEQLWRGVLAYVTYVDEHRQGWAVLHQELATRGGAVVRALADVRGAITHRTARLLEILWAQHGVRRDDAEVLAAAFTGACEAMANWYLEHPDVPAETVASRLMECGWLGLRAVAEGDGWTTSRPDGS